ncbi:unnamed protein product [Echinostoma caproni]|uniref:Histone deacetylase 1 n=1 Tax=Echinostoma caproni TaxID=27848 RepID=A0A183AME4_9TREM|nr:unnamed protein product [Echinostoma caproni]
MANQNTCEYLDNIKAKIFENMRMIPHCPSVQMQDIPPDTIDVEEAEAAAKDFADPDKRISILAADKAVMPENEFYDEPEEGSGAALRSGKSASRDVQNHRDPPKRARTEEDGASTAKDSSSKDSNINKKADVASDKVN